MQRGPSDKPSKDHNALRVLFYSVTKVTGKYITPPHPRKARYHHQTWHECGSSYEGIASVFAFEQDLSSAGVPEIFLIIHITCAEANRQQESTLHGI